MEGYTVHTLDNPTLKSLYTDNITSDTSHSNSTYFRQLNSNNKQRGAFSTSYVSADKIRVADKATISLPGPSPISPVHASSTNGSIVSSPTFVRLGSSLPGPTKARTKPLQEQVQFEQQHLGYYIQEGICVFSCTKTLVSVILSFPCVLGRIW